MGEMTVTIATFNNPVEANIIKGKLESEGITVLLFDEHTITMLPIYSHALGDIKLRVHINDKEKAEQILKKEAPSLVDDFLIQHENEHLPEIKCPNCFSTNVFEKKLSRKSLLSFLLVGFPIPLFSPRFGCFECGYRWKNKNKK